MDKGGLINSPLLFCSLFDILSLLDKLVFVDEVLL